MVLQVLSKDDDDGKLQDKIIGPFQKMMHALQNAEDRIESLELQLSQVRNQYGNNVTTGGYWSDSTGGSYPTIGGGPIWTTTTGTNMLYGNNTSSLDKEYLDKLTQWTKLAPKVPLKGDE
jgi:hypothetical protein